MQDFEDLQEASANESTLHGWGYPHVSPGVDVHVTPESHTGRVSHRTSTNRHYADVHTERDFYTLKDKKYRSLWLPTKTIKAAGAGRDGTYVDMWKYAPSIPVITRREPRHYQVGKSNVQNDTMTLLDPEHALNASKVDLLSHGGIRDIESLGPTNGAVDNVVPSTGPDAKDLDEMRGLGYQFNYSSLPHMNKRAKKNFMAAVAGLYVRQNTTARPASGVVAKTGTFGPSTNVKREVKRE